INNRNKHVDDHAIAFRADDPDYILYGSDGGLYESYDDQEHWRHIANLPVTQFYKVAADDAEPFYYVHGGTQDNSTQAGPSRTENWHGVRNSDWAITLGGDGHQPAVEPGNPDIAYAQWQRGNIARIDRTNDEVVDIKPRAAPGEPAERHNWDAPILVSAHDPARIFTASQRLWRSDDRGDTWRALSGDLTRDQDRMLLPLMGRRWSWDAAWDLYAMSDFNTITSIAESPVDENILYVGTDDGLIQASADGGASWRAIEVGSLPGAPAAAYVNDIKADLFDPSTVYVALSNHKEGDFAPYLYKSEDAGARWSAMTGDLPDDHLVWRIVQDHEDPDLFFLGTEFGALFTVDGGERWVELSGAPTIAFRDVVIQRRENDLVGGTFGRGIYILDDYSPLRAIDDAALEEEALLFAGRRAWWYMERHPLGFGANDVAYGDQLYRAPNPPFGAVFTYYLAEDRQTLAQIRQDAEEPANEAGEDTPFPGFDAVEAERRETPPQIWLTVTDADGEAVARLPGPVTAGVHRVSWNLRYPPAASITTEPRWPYDELKGRFAAPGRYSVTLSERLRGRTRVLAGPESFDVVPLREGGALEGSGHDETAAFWERIVELERGASAAVSLLGELDGKLDHLRTALERSRSGPSELDDQWAAIRAEVYAIEEALRGRVTSSQMGAQPETVMSRLAAVQAGTSRSTYGPTPTHVEQIGYAEQEFAGLRDRLNALIDETIPSFEEALAGAGAPWTPGGRVPAP
ncbi:MAG: hypothetical protein MI723_11085, partial [Caulobacterales bacterium]|nr:hypothetical protein [Caulobacterales bacterium]